MKMKNSHWWALILVGAFLFSWHHRGGLLTIAKTAYETNAELSRACGQ
ncbi:hypothetical protein [Pseudoxanthomonas suwonensis]